MNEELKRLLEGTDQPNLSRQKKQELLLKNLITHGLKARRLPMNKENVAMLLFPDGDPENYEGEIPQWYRELPDET